MRGIILALALSACGRGAEVGLPPGALIGACDGWVAGSCLRDAPKTLAVWLPDALVDPSVRWDGAPVALQAEPRGGQTATIGVVEAGELVVEVGGRSWRVTVGPSTDPPEVRDMWRVWDGRKSNPSPDAELRALVTAGLSSTDAHTAAVAREMDSRLLDRAGEHDAAEAAMREAQRAYTALGRSDLWPRMLLTHGAAILGDLARWEESGALVAEVAAAADPRLDTLAFSTWLDGKLHANEADVRGALKSLRRSVWAYRLIGHDKRAMAEQELAAILQAGGLHGDALAIDAEHALSAAGDTSEACWRSWSLSTYGYALVIASEAGFDPSVLDDASVRAVGTDPVPLLQTALDNLREVCARDPGLREDVLINLALALLNANRLAEAGAALDLVPPDDDGEERLFEAARIRGEIALRRGHAADAFAHFSEASLRAATLDRGRGMLLSMVGQARALAALGRADDALDLYRRADSQARLFSVALPLDQGRDVFLTEWDRMAGDWIALLVKVHRQDEAAAVLRDLRGALLGQLVWARGTENLSPEESARWRDAVRQFTLLQESMEDKQKAAWELDAQKLAAWEAAREVQLAEMKAVIDRGLPERVLRLDAPRARPGPGEVLVTWLEGADGVYAFAIGEGGATVRGPFPRPEADLGPTSAWFLPIADALRAAKRVVLLPAGRLRGEDLHVRKLDGVPLIERAEVVWSLDLPARPALSGGQGAVVIADPLDDLENARLEGEQVAAALSAAGVPTQLWSGGQATAARLADGLGKASLLHYAGHGRAGLDALSAELLLADHEAFAVANALGSPRVPARVVLSGCETARSVATDVESLGLGQAFVVAGSSAVIAAVRPVDDAAARLLIDGLYAAGLAQGDPAAAFRAAVRGALAQGVDVSAFRLLVP